MRNNRLNSWRVSVGTAPPKGRGEDTLVQHPQFITHYYIPLTRGYLTIELFLTHDRPELWT